MGGSLADGISVVEQYLSSKNYTIIPVAPLPF
jgi:predicted CoA-binding protein